MTSLQSVRLLSFTVFAALSMAASAAHADKTIRVPADQATITKAMEAAAAGDTVLVAPGTYTDIVAVKDGVVLRSESGTPENTTIVYGEPAPTDQNQAVLSLQRCSNSTQIVGLTIDGGDKARRGILAIGDGSPVISNCTIRKATVGINTARNAAPYVQFTRAEACSLAGIHIQGGTGDIHDCDLSGNTTFGLLVGGTTTPLRVRDCRIQSNREGGVQATEGEFAMTGGVVSGNRNGILLQYVSPTIQSVTIEGNSNIGVAIENSTGTLLSCTIRNNNFGVVVSGTGDPKVFQCTFEDNPKYHLGVEGDAVPVIGGSLENANLFLGKTDAVIQSQASSNINATFNYWGKPCASKDQVKVLPGAKDVIRKPWVTADLKTSFTSCEEARKHSRTPVGEGAEADEDEDEPAAPTPATGTGGAGAGAGSN
ncbi:MAG TPA: right-handed parallel beta-helix repeat-containing protein [bacterium]|nr:right-handed parallel beta-helix repeat-containing protein [bacterium]